MRTCVYCWNNLKRGVSTCNGCRRVQPSAQLAPYYVQAISEDATLILGNARHRLAARAKELKQLDRQPKKSDSVKSVETPIQKLPQQLSGKNTFEFLTQKSTQKLNPAKKIGLLGIPIVIIVLAVYLLTPIQKDSDPKNDKALIEELFYGLNDISSAQDQFTYIVDNNYPNFLNNSIAKACASRLKPATLNSYMPLVKPETVEVFKLLSISKNYSSKHSYDGSYGPDNEKFKGTEIVGRTYTVSVSDKLKSGGKTYDFDRDIKVTIKDGKAHWYTHYC